MTIWPLVLQKKPTARVAGVETTRTVAAGEFKARCLGLMREVADNGKPVLVTLRGKPLVEIVPARNGKRKQKDPKKDNFLGRLEGIMRIVGDPDDLIKPVFPLADYDMLK